MLLPLEPRGSTSKLGIVMDPGAICACVIGLLISQRDLDLQQVLSTELTACPPSKFHADRSMRQATGKSALEIQLHVEVSQHLRIPPRAAVLGVSAVLWTVTWAVHASVDTFIQTFKAWLARQPQVCDIHLCFDLHHQQLPQTPLPNRESVSKTSANKAQLNALISNEVPDDNAFLKSATASHQLVVTGEKTNPVQLFKGHIFSRRDLSITHEKQTPPLSNMPSISPKKTGSN